MEDKIYQRYSSGWAYWVKLIILVAITVYSLYYMLLVILAVPLFFLIFWLIDGVSPFQYIKDFYSFITGIKNQVFVIKISEDHLETNDYKVFYTDINSFSKSRGGSEPFLMLNNGQRVDLELSWLKKSDQFEVENFISTKLKTDNR